MIYFNRVNSNHRYLWPSSRNCTWSSRLCSRRSRKRPSSSGSSPTMPFSPSRSKNWNRRSPLWSLDRLRYAAPWCVDLHSWSWSSANQLEALFVRFGACDHFHSAIVKHMQLKRSLSLTGIVEDLSLLTLQLDFFFFYFYKILFYFTNI